MTDASPAADRLDPRTPVLVGAGVGGTGAPPEELMAVATERALADAGGRGLADAVAAVSVAQGSWSDGDPARHVAARVGARAARTELTELGIPQQRLIDDALRAILGGADGLFVVTGGEARRWARSQQPASEEGVVGAVRSVGRPVPGRPPDVVHRRQGPLVEPTEVEYRLWEPMLQYAMIEQALIRAEGRSMSEGRTDIAELWAGFNRVATVNPLAAFGRHRSAEEIATPSPDNRPLAFPYNKWHASQWTVDQAAALVLCSVEVARRLRVPTDRWLFPLVGLDSSHAVSLLVRQDPHRWPAMGVLGRAAQDRLGRPVADCELVELYSCFPSAVRVQQRELGLDPSGVPTVTGGMAFAGGPFNNFVFQSTVAVAGALRDRPEALGMVTTVSGLLTKPGLAVWSARPDGRLPLVGDLAAECRDATPTVAVEGPAPEGATPEQRGGSVTTVVAATTTYEGMAPRRTVALCHRPDDRRVVAMSDDADVATVATTEGLVGRAVRVEDRRLRLA